MSTTVEVAARHLLEATRALAGGGRSRSEDLVRYSELVGACRLARSLGFAPGVDAHDLAEAIHEEWASSSDPTGAEEAVEQLLRHGRR